MVELIKEDELKKLGISPETLFAKFKEQLYRDFEMCNVHSYLSPIENSSYDQIHFNIQSALDKIQDAGYSLYSQLLYRIDISEKQFAGQMHEQKGKAENDILAGLIIKRILQKVILKIVYSK